MMREASCTGSGLRNTALVSVKIAVFAPIPRASESTAAATNPGLAAKVRKAYFTSCARFSILIRYPNVEPKVCERIARRRFLFLAYFSPTPVSSYRRFPLPPGTIVSHGSTDHVLQSPLIDFVALVEINRSPFIPVQAGVKELVRIWKACALIKGQLHLILVSVAHRD